MSEINSIQEEIIGEFEILGDDKESTIYYIMELGDQLPEFPEKDKVEERERFTFKLIPIPISPKV